MSDSKVPNLWSTERESGPRTKDGDGDKRTAFEHDFDRLLFSTPVRRLADKTQVFPLDKNDSVRTRLTHSHEVSNIAKSIGLRLIRTFPAIFGDDDAIRAAAPTILATVGLAHDLGNPPFGHQGERAISRWFAENPHVFDAPAPHDAKGFEPIPKEIRGDFLAFEGNAQSIRLVSRLQNTAGPSGLNLTATTLAALMKYPVPSNEVSKANAASKKYGYFASESALVDWIRESTGLQKGQRHPLTWIMEAADDIAYSVLDIEDSIKKGLVSAEDLLAFLRGRFDVTDLGGLVKQLEIDFENADKCDVNLSRVREVKASYLRTRLIERLITGAADAYSGARNDIFSHKRTKALLDSDNSASVLCNALKDFARAHAYASSAVLEIELQGANVIKGLMDEMWTAIADRESFAKLSSKRRSPKAGYVYSLISDSYRWYFEQEAQHDRLPIRYKEAQLLTDMVSGMTDGFAVDLHRKIAQSI